MAKLGRPSIYTEEIADNICEIIATSSKSMVTICTEVNIPISTVLSWLSTVSKENGGTGIPNFVEKYARAKELQADYLAEEILDISDDGRNDFMCNAEGEEYENKEWTSRSKLRVDARKWIASKLKPKKYGDKLEIDQSIKIESAPDWLSKPINNAQPNE